VHIETPQAPWWLSVLEGWRRPRRPAACGLAAACGLRPTTPNTNLCFWPQCAKLWQFLVWQSGAMLADSAQACTSLHASSCQSCRCTPYQGGCSARTHKPPLEFLHPRPCLAHSFTQLPPALQLADNLHHSWPLTTATLPTWPTTPCPPTIAPHHMRAAMHPTSPCRIWAGTPAVFSTALHVVSISGSTHIHCCLLGPLQLPWPRLHTNPLACTL